MLNMKIQIWLRSVVFAGVLLPSIVSAAGHQKEDWVRTLGDDQTSEASTSPNMKYIWKTTFLDGSYILNDRNFFQKKKPFHFQNNGNIRIEELEEFSNCLLGERGFLLKDKNKKVLWRRFLIRINEKPTYKEFYRISCSAVYEGGDVLGYSVRVGLYAKFFRLGFVKLRALKDDTFWAVLNKRSWKSGPAFENLSIRFDKHLDSPFLKQRKDVYVIDMVELEALILKAYRYMEKNKTNPFEYFDNLLTKYLINRGHRP